MTATAGTTCPAHRVSAFLSLVSESNSYSIEIICQNIRSLRSNFDLLVAGLSSFTKSPEIIIVTEIWIDEEESNLYKLSDYELFLNTNKTQRPGGVGIYISSKILVSNYKKVNFVSADVLEVSIKVYKTSFSFLVVYRLHAYNIEVFLQELQCWLRSNERVKNLFVVGDININLLEQNNAQVDLYKTIMAENGLESLVNEPTRVSGTCIDHLYVRLENMNKVNIRADVKMLVSRIIVLLWLI